MGRKVHNAISVAIQPETRSMDRRDELSFRINVFRDLFEEFNGPPKVDDVFFPKTHEWKFIIRYRGENVPVGISEDEPHWLLFKNESTILNDLLTQAKTEIEPLFAAIKEIGFSARNLDANDENWMHATLQYFDGNQTHFNLVRKKYLQDKNLYAFAPGQEARDFKGCLLEKIVKGNGLEENNPGARNLVKLYREIG